jgi:hypothetical protein
VFSVAYPALFIRCRDYVRIRLTSHLLITGDHSLTHRSQFHCRNVVAKLLALLTLSATRSSHVNEALLLYVIC